MSFEINKKRIEIHEIPIFFFQMAQVLLGTQSIKNNPRQSVDVVCPAVKLTYTEYKI